MLEQNIKKAIKRCKKLITEKFNLDYSIDNIDKEAIETVLQALENSIPKEVIRNFIKENAYTDTYNFKTINVEKLQELLDEK